MTSTIKASPGERGSSRDGVPAVTAKYTVYTKPECPNCDKTKAYFEAKGITYTAVDITENPAALEYITGDLGYSQAPVVVNNADDQDHWSGLRRDKLVTATMNHAREGITA
ncbi:glutaredoxin family protein [Arthrobacter sp. Leaf141]|uniref:glutaredoxin family protein n=1 Tax=Arthrobacter sp. Leaf141 TaxID=1736273 RepID=UPI0009E910A8